MKPVIDASIAFDLGSRSYVARPTGSRHRLDDSRTSEEASLVTIFQVNENQTVDADDLRAWRASLLDEDDVFHPAFLQEIIFGGAEVHLDSDVGGVFKSWETLHVTFAPHLHIADGPYLLKHNLIFSVWRVYEDCQLAFVQATWPSLGEAR